MFGRCDVARWTGDHKSQRPLGGMAEPGIPRQLPVIAVCPLAPVPQAPPAAQGTSSRFLTPASQGRSLIYSFTQLLHACVFTY